MKCILSFINTTKIVTAFIMVIMLSPMLAKSVQANDVQASAMYELVVTYTDGVVKSGPLSFGLTELPSEVTATFILGPGSPYYPEPEDPPGDVYFDEADSLFGRIKFGDATWSVVENLFMVYRTSDDEVTELGYNFYAIDTPTAQGPIVLNFPLSVTGIDKASGLPFEYGYTTSTQILTPVVQTLDVAIDIKPNSDKNCFNINGHGVIPVAILGSMDLSVSQIDITSLSFGGLAVRVRGNKGALCSIEYSNEDEYLDLICHFEDNSSNWDAGDGEAMVTGSLIDSTTFEGSDSICVVP